MIPLVPAMTAAVLSLGSTAVSVNFARGHWNAADFTVVKSPRFDYCNGFVQREGWIENRCPDVSAEDVFRKHNARVYASMVWKERLNLGATVSTTTGWDWRMAPLVVIAPELGVAKDGKTPEFREHWEVVVFDGGLNVWHHYWSAGKGPSWVKAASLALPEAQRFKANEKHALSVRIARNAKGRKELTATCGGFALQYVDDTLPESFYAGILGCEGRNFFWDFTIK